MSILTHATVSIAIHVPQEHEYTAFLTVALLFRICPSIKERAV